MSKVSQLAQKIRSLPDIVSERTRIAIVRRVNQDVKDTLTELTIIYRQAPHIDTLRPSEMVPTVSNSISTAITQAKALKKLLGRDNFGTEKKISDHLDNLRRIRQALETKRTAAWSKVQSEVLAVETLLNIATALRLASVASLQEAVRTFREATKSAPKSEKDTEEIIKAREKNKIAIANSGLTGNVKKILEGAINAVGDPKLLLEEDVKQFLTDHPELWRTLKLKLG